MKHQQVSVDYWAMGKSMVTYALLAGMGWIMLRLFNTVFMLPRRMRSQQESIQHTLNELQRRYPDLHITEDDLKKAEQELEDLINEDKDKEENKALEESGENKDNTEEKANTETQIEDKKTI